MTPPAPAAQFIAHRVGNDPLAIAAWAGQADLIEVDVHLWRGRLEVRHAKRAWPFARLWERRAGLLPRHSAVPDLETVLDVAARTGSALWLDCKGIDPRLFPRLATATDAVRPLTVSSKSWWLLGPFCRRRGEGVRVFRSAGNRLELLLARRLPSRLRLDGLVVHERLLDERLVAELRAGGREIVSWAVADTARAEQLLRWGVRGLILDDRALLTAMRCVHRPEVPATAAVAERDVPDGGVRSQ